MATRFLLSSHAPTFGIAPTPDASWGVVSPSLLRAGLTPSADGSPDLTVSATETSATPVNMLMGQFISPPLAAQTITGNLSAVYMHSTTTGGVIGSQSRVVAYVRQSNGTVVGTLYAGVPNPAQGASTGFRVNGAVAVAMTSLAVSAGDRIVVEIGVRHDNTDPTSFTSNVRFGASATTDLAFAQGATGGRPWVEISTDLTFQTQARESAETVEVLGKITAADALASVVWAEALGVQIPVQATLTSAWVEVFGVQKPVEASLTAAWVEVLGIAGEPPVEVTGLSNVARTGILRIKDPDGTWKTPLPLGIP